MKTIHLIYVLLMLTLGGCVTPGSHLDAQDKRQDYDVWAWETAVDTIEFKHAFIYAVPMKEKSKFDNTIINSDYTSDYWDKIMQREGWNGIAVASTGAGSAVGLGMSLVDSYIESRPMMNRFSVAYASVPKDSPESVIDALYDENVKKTKNAIYDMATEFGYTVKSVYNCNNAHSTYELTRIAAIADIDPLVYAPNKLVVTLVLKKYVVVPNEASQIVIRSNDTEQAMIADGWNILIADVDVTPIIKYNHKPLNYVDGVSDYVSPSGDNAKSTPLGRNMLRSIAKGIPFWVYYDNENIYDFGIYKGKSYVVVGTSDIEDLRGFPSTN